MQQGTNLLDGRTALVTGARTGIGRAIAEALGAAGAAVFVHGHGGDMGPVEENLRRLDAYAGTVHFDVRDAAGAREAMDRLTAAGPVDILVNNAAITHREAVWDYPLEEWEAIVSADLTTPFVLAQSAARAMMTRRRGKIINLASMQSFQGGILIVAYAAAKHGIQGMTRAMATELAPHGIQVNAIAPGYIETSMTEALRRDEGRREEILRRIPSGRWGQAADVAGAALFLASSWSDYVVGHTLVVDGGWLAR